MENIIFDSYKRKTLKQRKGQLKARENELSQQILNEHFGKGQVKKAKRISFMNSDEYAKRLEQSKQNDEIYLSLSQSPDELTDQELQFFEDNKEILLQMQQDGHKNFGKYAVQEYLSRYKEREDEARAKAILQTWLSEHDYADIDEFAFDTALDLNTTNLIEEIEDHLSTNDLTYTSIHYDHRYRRSLENHTITPDNIYDYIDTLPCNDEYAFWSEYYLEHVAGVELFSSLLCNEMEGILHDELSPEDYTLIFHHYSDSFVEAACENDGSIFNDDEAKSILSTKKVIELLKKNPYLKQVWEEIDKREYQDNLLKTAMLDHIPDSYADLYPLARSLNRKFILHIGPTNSGKTYSAIEEMLKSNKGIYLGPLRLLAFEQFEKINSLGIPCSLITGEEEILRDNARFQASTIEILDTKNYYDVAVIDEAQMLNDEYRGGAWTQAILGLYASEIHVCAAPNAENILIRLIEECHDTYEVIHHDRRAELKLDDTEFKFPGSVMPGDALIVFSRKKVHAVAAELQDAGIKCSIIYGALPYDVRHEEARKFMEHETNVLVATDAIGMGLNLPIKRVVLMEHQKFDGKNVRHLLAEEIQQIVGRAGRAGIYDTGLYNTKYDNRAKILIQNNVESKLKDIQAARMSFPESLLGVGSKLSDLLSKWNELPSQEGYNKASTEEKIKLAQSLEPLTDDKFLIYRFIMIPFDIDDMTLKAEWYTFARNYIKNGKNDIAYPDIITTVNNMDELHIAEGNYALLDLKYQLCRHFGKKEQIDGILSAKIKLSKEMINFLAKHKLKGKRCSMCGKKLPWDYKYGYCQRCYNTYHRGPSMYPDGLDNILYDF